MVKFVLQAPVQSPEQEPKTPLSSSLPQLLAEQLALAAGRLKREKALVIRTALDLFLRQSEAGREKWLMDYYRTGPQGSPQPLTTTLSLSQKDGIEIVAKTLHRSKADVLRAALYNFFRLPPQKREAAVMEYMSL